MKLYGRLIIFLYTSLLLPSLSHSQTLTIENPVRFLALGDSYTIGQSVPVNARWPVQLSDSLVARGFNLDTLRIIATTGWRTDNLINAIKNQHLANQNYTLVSLLIGVNNQYQSRPFSQYITEFPALVDSSIRYAGGDKSHVFIVSIPDYAYTPFGQQSSNPGQISAEIDQYNAFSKHIADSLQIKYFNITPISRLGLQHPSYVASDGLHPSGIQYTEWVKLMLAFIDTQITATGEIATNALNVTVYPNPSSGTVDISIPEVDANHSFDIRLYTLMGKPLANKTFHGNAGNFSIDNIPDGLYLLHIISGEKQTTRKIIKKS